MTIEERLKHRQLTVKPLVDAYFTWAKQNLLSVTPKSKTAKGLTYSLNQEKYLKTFLEDGEVPMDIIPRNRQSDLFVLERKTGL